MFCDGKPLTQIAGLVGEGDVQEAWQGRKGKDLADLEDGSFYYDRGTQQLYLWLPGGEDPAQHVVEAQVRSGGISTCDLNYYDIAGFKVTHASVGMGGSFGSHNTLENMEVTYADFCGISVGGSFNTLTNCKSNCNGNTGISTYNRGHRVIHCEVRFNNRRRWSAGWHAGGMQNFSSDTVVSGCIAEGNVESPGIWFDGSNTGVTIESCRCFRNGLGIMYEIGERAIVKNNICDENTGRGISISNSAYCSIVHNRCYRNGISGVVLIGVEREGGFVGDEETTYAPARCNVVWGNILMDNCYPGLAIKGWEGRPELIMPDERIKSNAGNVSDYNLFYRSAQPGIQPETLSNLLLARPADIDRWSEQPLAAGYVQECLIRRSRFHQGREFLENHPDLIRDLGVVFHAWPAASGASRRVTENARMYFMVGGPANSVVSGRRQKLSMAPASRPWPLGLTPRISR